MNPLQSALQFVAQLVDFEIEGRRVGLNINAAAVDDWTELDRTLLSVQPRGNLVMDNANQAIRIANMLPKSIVVGRFYHPRDGRFWLNFLPHEAVEYAKNKGARPHDRVWWEVNNEPHTGDEETIRAWIDWEIQTARAFAAEGLHYVTALVPSKSIHKDLVERGIYDPLLQELHDNPFFHLGIHEYGYLFPMAQWMANYPRNMFSTAAMQPENWPGEIPWSRRADGVLPDNWHLGRVAWLQIRAEEMDLGRIPYIITEAMHDNMDDVSRLVLPDITGTLPIKEWVKQFNGGHDVNGMRSLEGLYQRVLPGWPFEDLLYLMMRWGDLIYSPECIAICLFTYSTNLDWYWFWVQPLKTLLSKLALLPIRRGLMEGIPVVEYPVIDAPTALQPYTVQSVFASGIRIREQPRTSSAQVGLVPAEALSGRVYNPAEPIIGGDYQWVFVELVLDGQTVRGWVARHRISTGEDYLVLNPQTPPAGQGEICVRLDDYEYDDLETTIHVNLGLVLSMMKVRYEVFNVTQAYTVLRAAADTAQAEADAEVAALAQS
ncbi:hypothetical protein G4Y79_20945 [Phototrophicus methaneseepsis]|uniref:Uncharacterized protein n=1 Tax=Phototrophicus methaneseepsis TaxID=2710758 RepID=A0A7S8ID27_9CHLR|nr:hypothetical protein [Phototrophicus methaneseepsis]QPC82125.1 hypothetical protein G4Y79_20945 [Phototrophicus methaneseepsis]